MIEPIVEPSTGIVLQLVVIRPMTDAPEIIFGVDRMGLPTGKPPVFFDEGENSCSDILGAHVEASLWQWVEQRNE